MASMSASSMGSSGCACGHLAAEVFVGEHQRTVHKVAEDGHQLVIVLRLKITPRKFTVFSLGQNGAEGVAQDVFFARKFIQVLVQPHRPVATGRYFFVLLGSEIHWPARFRAARSRRGGAVLWER